MSLYRACRDGLCCRVGCATCRKRRDAKIKGIPWFWFDSNGSHMLKPNKAKKRRVPSTKVSKS